MQALKKYNTILIAKPQTKLKNLVHRKIDPTHKYEKTAVYFNPFKINSSMKTYTYVGMTVWKLLERFKEHMIDIVRSKLTTALSRLYHQMESNILFKKVKIIARNIIFL